MEKNTIADIACAAVLRANLACERSKNIFWGNYTQTLSTDSKWTDSKNHSAEKNE